jgi:hypothetical protein
MAHLNVAICIVTFANILLAVAFNIVDIDSAEDSPNALDRRQAPQKCFEGTTDEEKLELNIKEIFMDKSITGCFIPLKQEEIYRCLSSNIMTMEESYRNVTSEFCPTWARSKTCLFNFLSTRCDAKERELIEKSAAFNSELALPSLMCESGLSGHLQHILAKTQEEGLWGCFSNNTAFVSSFKNCTVGSRYLKNHMFPEYERGLHKFASCTKKALHICAEGDRVKELRLRSIWNEIEDTFDSAYALFWEEFKGASESSE